MFKKLDKLSLLVGRMMVYPTAFAVLLGILYVPTYGWMHKDDQQMVVTWKKTPAGVSGIDGILNRTDFEMTEKESKKFMKFVESAEPNDMITVNGLRFKRSSVGRVRYFSKNEFPAGMVDKCGKLYLQAKSRVNEITADK